jgi:hypothetical protein
MNIESAFPSKYLKAADLQGRRIEVIMADVKTEKLGDDLRPVVYFKGKERGLVLNKTNANTIITAYGRETDDWFGQPIVLYEAQVEFSGRQVSAIRVTVPRVQETSRRAQAPLHEEPRRVESMNNSYDPVDLDGDSVPF